MADEETDDGAHASEPKPRPRETGTPPPPPTPPPSPPAAAPTAQEIAAALITLQQPAERQFVKLEIWALLLTGVMAIATIVSSIIARDQWVQLRLQNSLISTEQTRSNTSSKRITRAYITFSGVEISRYSETQDRVTVNLRNVGQTPAYIGLSKVGLIYYRRGSLTAAVKSITLKDTNLFGYSVGAGEPFRRTVEFDIDPDLRKIYGRRNDVERLVVFLVHYKDIYGDQQSYISCPFRNRDWDRMSYGPRVTNCQQFFPEITAKTV